MTRSEQIKEMVRQEIIGAATQLTKPDDLRAWAGERGLLYVHVSAATGASLADCKAKFSTHQIGTSKAEIDRLSEPLTAEYYPGKAASWDDDYPRTYLTQMMAAALDEMPANDDGYARAQRDMVTSLYRDCLGREPDAKGLADHLAQLRSGRSFFTKAIDFYWSPEAVALRDRGHGTV